MTKEIQEKIRKLRWEGFNAEVAAIAGRNPDWVSMVINGHGKSEYIWKHAYNLVKQNYKEFDELAAQAAA